MSTKNRKNETPAGAPPPAAPHEQDTIEEMQAKMVEVHERGNTIRATADAEHRMLTEEETKELDELSAQFDSLDAEVQRRQRILAQRDRLTQPQRRVTQPGDLEGNAGTGAPAASGRIEGGYAPGASKGTGGFRSVGEFAKAVLRASRGDIDKRLIAAETTYGSTGEPADGGHALPPDFRATIVKQLEGEDSLLAKTDQQFTSSNKLTVPIDATTPWQTTGGIQAYWEGEGEVLTKSKPLVDQLEVKAHKIAALVKVTDELLEDVPALSRYLPGKVADKLTSAINEAIVNGNGAGKPQGLLESGSLITVAPEAGQTAPIVYENIVKMWARLYAKLRKDAIWLINQDLEPALHSMIVPGAQPAHPAYLPPGGLSQAPYATLMGRPVLPLEACAEAGQVGAITLFSPSSYLTVQKVGGGIRQDVSIHVNFDQMLTAFRFVVRVGGQSWWKTKAQKAKGTNHISNIVTLGEVGA